MADTQQLESEVLRFWAKNKIFQKLMKSRAKGPRFSFQDGPITANNPMGVHHCWNRTHKDLYLRFKSMQGSATRRQNGFDCQGLWIEREEEKDRGFKTKADIEAFGLENWANACRTRVLKFAKLMTEDSIRLGMWMDWNNSYYTMTDTNNLHNWYLLKEYHRRGWLYKGKDAVPWCPRCGTASSKHDIITEGYKEVTHTALFMRFPLKGKKDEYLLIFTTTPWTVPANVATAVNEGLNYVKISHEGKFYWLAEARLPVIKGYYEIVEKLTGHDLVGLEYESPYSKLPVQHNVKHRIVAWELASGEEGTGIVHIAPGCGPEDYDLGKREKLPAISPLDETGRFVKNWDWLTGMTASESNPEIIEDMSDQGFVYRTDPYKHRYPHCFRCGAELVFRLVDEWYVRAAEIREKLKAANKKVKWWPPHTQQQQEAWFDNMSDWLISRKRYWGLPLPFWECECGHLEIIGSMKELKQKAVRGMDQLSELHRPWIDRVFLKCPKCKKEMKRVPDVGDAWLDAGIVPFSTIGPYLENKSYWSKWYPVDFITECAPGQYRGWFNALFWAGITLSGKAPFKSALGSETVKDAAGKEMHKSWGNAIYASEALDKIGADNLRWVYCTQDPGAELWFGWELCAERNRPLVMLFNTIKYLETYAIANRFKPTTKKPKKLDPASEWLLSRLQTVKANITNHMESLQPHLAAKELQDFVMNDISRWYGHIIRDDIKPASKSAYKQGMLWTFYIVSRNLVKLFAPFTPFVTEHFWQEFFRKFEKTESVHLCDWPEPIKGLVRKKLESDMEIAKRIIEAASAARVDAGIGLRYELRALTISGNKDAVSVAKNLDFVLKKMANVSEVKVGRMEPVIVAKPNWPVAGKKFGKEMQAVAKLIAGADAKKLKAEMGKKGSAKLGKFTIKSEDISFTESLPEGLSGKEFEGGLVVLDTTQNDTLVQKWLVSELIRAVQEKRKQLKLNVSDRIRLVLGDEKAFKGWVETIADETGSKVGFGQLSGERGEFEFENRRYHFGIIK